MIESKQKTRPNLSNKPFQTCTSNISPKKPSKNHKNISEKRQLKNTTICSPTQKKQTNPKEGLQLQSHPPFSTPRNPTQAPSALLRPSAPQTLLLLRQAGDGPAVARRVVLKRRLGVRERARDGGWLCFCGCLLGFMVFFGFLCLLVSMVYAVCVFFKL